MPRYYFDVHDGTNIVDDEGIECADLKAVRFEAVRAAGGMLRDHAFQWDGKPWTMSVRDQGGKIVATLTFTAD